MTGTDTEAKTAVQSKDSWIPYLDQMGQKTRKYIEGMISKGLEFGKGNFGSSTTLELIADISQIDDDLGQFYAEAFDATPLGYLEFLENPGIVLAAKENPINFMTFITAVKTGSTDTEMVRKYAKAMGLTD